ncbi:MAG: YkgJ family cysteine cluster protein [Pseudomonadota bacterium]
MVTTALPQENICRIDSTQAFSFACHPGVKCFTECCRLLELALTPYDVLRLRKATGLTSEELLEKYIICEQDPGEAFPRLYLTMVDDGRASCIFVGKDGCSVYEHRPGACRAYPLGRAVTRTDTGAQEHFVILKETHCQGFLEAAKQSPTQYCHDQELTLYNQFNDAVLEILQHDAIRRGFIPSHRHVELFVLALYNLDTFRRTLLDDRLEHITLNYNEKMQLQNDENLLKFGITVLNRLIFAQCFGTMIK